MLEYLADEAAGLDSAIAQVETLYRSLTGQELPVNGTRIPIPPNPARFVRDETDRLLQMLDAFVQDPSYPAFVPVMHTVETADEVVIRIDLPGVPRSAVSVMFSTNALEVSGDRPMAHGDEFGEPFVRVVPLPPNVYEDEAKATFRDGVLEVRIPVDSAEAATPSAPVDLEKLQMLYDRVHPTIEALEGMRAKAYAGRLPAIPPQYGFGAGISSMNIPSRFEGLVPHIAGLAAVGLPLAMPLFRPDLQWLAEGLLPFPWRS